MPLHVAENTRTSGDIYGSVRVSGNPLMAQNLSPSGVVFATTSGILQTDSDFVYNPTSNTLFVRNIGFTGLTPGSVLFVGVSGQISENNPHFYWDYNNARLGIGINGTPAAKLHVDNDPGNNVDAFYISNDDNIYNTRAIRVLSRSSGIDMTIENYAQDQSGVKLAFIYGSPTGSVFNPNTIFNADFQTYSVTSGLNTIAKMTVGPSTAIGSGSNVGGFFQFSSSSGSVVIPHFTTSGATNYSVGLDITPASVSKTGLFIHSRPSQSADLFNVSDSSSNEWFSIGASDIIINESAQDRDLRIEGTGEANLFVIDAANNCIGLGGVASSTNRKTISYIRYDNVSVNSSNLWSAFSPDIRNININSGIYDSGFRAGFNLFAYPDSTGFEGTLEDLIGGYIQIGVANNTAGSGNINFAYGLLVQAFSGGTNHIVEDIYGLFVEDLTSGLSMRNHIDGRTTFGVSHLNPGNFAVSVQGDVGPRTDNTYELGHSDYRWKNINSVSGHFSFLKISGNNVHFGNVGTNQIAFGSGGGVYGHPRFIFDSVNYKYGFGNTTPTGYLHITPTGSTQATVSGDSPIARFQRGAGGGNFIDIFAETVGNFIVSNDTATNNKSLYNHIITSGANLANNFIVTFTDKNNPFTITNERLRIAGSGGIANSGVSPVGALDIRSQYPSVYTAYFRGIANQTQDFIRVDTSSLQELFSLSPSDTVFNENSQDIDFRIESNNETHMFFVDGGKDVIGIRTDNPYNDKAVVLDAQEGSVSSRFVYRHFHPEYRFGNWRDGSTISVLPWGRLMNRNFDLIMSPTGYYGTTYPTGWQLYNNSGAGRPELTSSVINYSGCPNSSNKVLMLNYSGGAGGTTPGWGGYVHDEPTTSQIQIGPSGNAIDNFNKYIPGNRFLQVIWAKIPEGRTINLGSNPIGTSGTSLWLTPQSGTGKWEKYVALRVVDESGTLSTTSYVYLTGGSDTSFVWYVSSSQCIAIDEEMPGHNMSLANIGYKEDFFIGWGELYTKNTAYLSVDGGDTRIGTSGNPGSFKVNVRGNVGPNDNNVWSLGSSSYRWADFYSATGHVPNLLDVSGINGISIDQYLLGSGFSISGIAGNLSQNQVAFGASTANTVTGVQDFLWTDSTKKLNIACVASTNAIVTISGTNPDKMILTGPVNDGTGYYVRFTEFTNDYIGAYLHYNADVNRFEIGMHNTNSTSLSHDAIGISILRSNNFVGVGYHSAVSPLHLFENSSNTSTTCGFTVEQSGVGDAVVQYLLTGGQRWRQGIDNSDSNKFKIARGSDLNTTQLITLTTDDKIGLINSTEPSGYLHLVPTGGAIDIFRVDNFANYERFSIGSGDVVFNDGGLDIDFRIIARNDHNIFNIDDGNKCIGVGGPANSVNRKMIVYAHSGLISSNQNNLWTALSPDLQNLQIASGVTDSGYRRGIAIFASPDSPTFEGNLEETYGIAIFHGVENGTAGSGSIDFSYGLYIASYSGGTNRLNDDIYGLYIDDLTDAGSQRNFIGGKTAFGHFLNPGEFTVSVRGDVGPQSGNVFDIGSSGLPWAWGYFNNLKLATMNGVLKAIDGVVDAGATTSHVPEGTNQYFTTTRVFDAITGSGVFVPGSVVFAGSNSGLAVDTGVFHWNATNNRLGIGCNLPAVSLHVSGSTNTSIRLSHGGSAHATLSGVLLGNASSLQLLAGAQNGSTNPFSPPIVFGSTDPQFSGLTPKFLAGMVGRGTETYDSDTKGGMALDFFITPNTPGSGINVITALSIDQNGRVGIGTGTPAATLHIKPSGSSLDGTEMLRFDGERSWGFYQRGTGALSNLHLADNTGAKQFSIDTTNFLLKRNNTTDGTGIITFAHGGANGRTSIGNTNTTTATTPGSTVEIYGESGVKALHINVIKNDCDVAYNSSGTTNFIYVDASTDSIGFGIGGVSSFHAYTFRRTPYGPSAGILQVQDDDGHELLSINPTSTLINFDLHNHNFISYGSGDYSRILLQCNSEFHAVGIGTVHNPFYQLLVQPPAIGSVPQAYLGIRDSGARELFGVNSSGVVVNETALDRDFRIESLNEPNLFFLDAGNNWINVGSSSNPGLFKVNVSGSVGPQVSGTFNLGSISQAWNGIHGASGIFDKKLYVGSTLPNIFGAVNIYVPSGSPDAIILRGDTNAVSGAQIRFVEVTGLYNGGFIKYDGFNDRFKIGVHHTVDALSNNDTDVIILDRATNRTSFASIYSNPGAFHVNSAGHLGPDLSGTYDLGSEPYRWRNIWSNSGVFNSLSVLGSGLTLVVSHSGNILDKQIAFASGNDNLAGNNLLYWNHSNNRLGIHTTTPSGIVEITSSIATEPFLSPILKLTRGAGGGGGNISFYANAGANWIVSDDPGTNQKQLVINVGCSGIDYNVPLSINFSASGNGSAQVEVAKFYGSGLFLLNTTNKSATFTVTNRAGQTGNPTVFIKGISSQSSSLLEIQNASNMDLFHVAPSHIVINEGGIDCDFRVESDINPNMIFMDAGNEQLNIGTNSNPGNFRVNISGNIGPETSGTRDIGSSAIYWNNLYCNNIWCNNINGGPPSGGGGTGGFPVDSGRIAFGNGTTLIGDSNLLWDSGNKRLSINAGAPFHTVAIRPASATTVGVHIAGLVSQVFDLLHVTDASSQEHFSVGTTDCVINEAGLDRDFRVESDNLANALFVNAGTDTVCINIGVPSTSGQIFHTHSNFPSLVTNSFYDWTSICHESQIIGIPSGVIEFGSRTAHCINASVTGSTFRGTLDSLYGNTITVGTSGLQVSGTISNVYGLYVNVVRATGVTQTREWGIYQTGNGNNYFAGQLRVGTTGNPVNFNILSAGHIGADASGTRDIGSTGVYWRHVYANNIVCSGINGIPFSGGTLGITIAQNQVAYAIAANTLGGSNNLWFDGTSLGVGNNAPEAKLHVSDGSAGTIAAYTDATMVIEDSSSSFIHFQTPNSVVAGLVFGDPDDNDIGRFYYNHSNDHFNFNSTAGSCNVRMFGTSTNDNRFYFSNGVNDQKLRFIHAGGSTLSILSMQPNGNVGIGALVAEGAADTLLHLDGGTSDTFLTLEKDETTNAGFKFDVAGSVLANITYNSSEDLVYENDKANRDHIFKIAQGTHGGGDKVACVIDASGYTGGVASLIDYEPVPNMRLPDSGEFFGSARGSSLDFIISDSGRGLVLRDRDDGKLYRLYIGTGLLGLELLS